MMKHYSAPHMGSTSENSARIRVNLAVLRKMKIALEDIREETFKPVSSNLISRARANANEVKSRQSQFYAQSAAKAVMEACDELESARRKALEDLRTMIYGLEKAIEGYPRQERELSIL
jgi:hypothetical protein